ncbi:MAG: sortase [Coriobacteriales bacterium]|nr:sortase [Coriobacteriales bacterium]
MSQKDTEGTEAQVNDAHTSPHTPKHVSPDDLSPAKKKRSIILLSIVLVVLIAGASAGAGYLAWQRYQLNQALQEAKEVPAPIVEDSAPKTEPTPEPLAVNPIDFSALKQENQDIYAWISIPNTEVDHPIFQHASDDNYYLTHNRDRQVSAEGALYSQSMNSTDFSDPVTLIYGHNMINKGMFATLHYFENADFFAANDVFYIYTPGHILTYRVVSAYLYDDRHIMNSFDFSNLQTVQDYFAFVQAPDALIANARTGVKLSSDDKIVQLSTCMSDPAYSSARYLVNGVLIDDELTY